MAEGAAEIKLVGRPDAGQVGVDQDIGKCDSLVPDFGVGRAYGLQEVQRAFGCDFGDAGFGGDGVKYGAGGQGAAHGGAIALTHAIKKGNYGSFNGQNLGAHRLG